MKVDINMEEHYQNGEKLRQNILDIVSKVLAPVRGVRTTFSWLNNSTLYPLTFFLLPFTFLLLPLSFVLPPKHAASSSPIMFKTNGRCISGTGPAGVSGRMIEPLTGNR